MKVLTPCKCLKITFPHTCTHIYTHAHMLLLLLRSFKYCLILPERLIGGTRATWFLTDSTFFVLAFSLVFMPSSTLPYHRPKQILYSLTTKSNTQDTRTSHTTLMCRDFLSLSFPTEWHSLLCKYKMKVTNSD